MTPDEPLIPFPIGYSYYVSLLNEILTTTTVHLNSLTISQNTDSYLFFVLQYHSEVLK